jgi:hypothetical protein
MPAVMTGAWVPQAPAAPRHLVLTNPTVFRRPPVVQVAQSNEPAVPSVPPSEVMYLNGLMAAQNQPSMLDATPEAALNYEISRREAEGIWVYDPVQERWAFRPEARARRAPRRAPAAVVPVPVGPPPVQEAPAGPDDPGQNPAQ